MKRLLVLTAALIVSACGTHRAPHWPMEKVLPSIGHLSALSPDAELQGECTSFAITKRTAITAAHCITESEKKLGGPVQLFIGEMRVSVPLDYGPLEQEGLVVVRADRDAFVPMKLGAKPVVGEDIAMVGHGFGAPHPLIWAGVLVHNSMPAPGETMPIMFVSPGSIGGMSGAPIVNRLGEVVGVTLGGFEGVLEHLSWGVEYDTLKAVWEKWAR